MIGGLVWNQGGQVGRGWPPGERGRPRALVKQALGWGRVVESAESEPKPHHCVAEGWLGCCSDSILGTRSKKVVTSFSLGRPAEDGEPSAPGSHPNPGGFPAAQLRARRKLMGQSRAREEPGADSAAERGRGRGRRWREGGRKGPSGRSTLMGLGWRARGSPPGNGQEC